MTDGLIKVDKFAPSQHPYAFLRDTLLPWTDHWIIDAVWAGRKRGKTIVSQGTLRLWDSDRGIDEVLASADMRYGASWEYQWDGMNLLVGPGITLPPDAYPAKASELDVWLKNFPSPPKGWDGWYYRRKEAE